LLQTARVVKLMMMVVRRRGVFGNHPVLLLVELLLLQLLLLELPLLFLELALVLLLGQDGGLLLVDARLGRCCRERVRHVSHHPGVVCQLLNCVLLR
jgi:hypothetical protein